jgi:hypothetical protein
MGVPRRWAQRPQRGPCGLRALAHCSGCGYHAARHRSRLRVVDVSLSLASVLPGLVGRVSPPSCSAFGPRRGCRRSPFVAPPSAGCRSRSGLRPSSPSLRPSAVRSGSRLPGASPAAGRGVAVSVASRGLRPAVASHSALRSPVVGLVSRFPPPSPAVGRCVAVSVSSRGLRPGVASLRPPVVGPVSRALRLLCGRVAHRSPSARIRERRGRRDPRHPAGPRAIRRVEPPAPVAPAVPVPGVGRITAGVATASYRHRVTALVRPWRRSATSPVRTSP